MGNLLTIRDLKVVYGRPSSGAALAVGSVNFEIASGEIVGLMGASGCGKTTIAKVILGLLPRRETKISGSVDFRGRSILEMDDRALREIRGTEIAMVSQEPSLALNPVMRVGYQVAEVIRAHRKIGSIRCRVEAQRALERVGLRDLSRTFRAYPHQLSGGQKQRVLLAQALVCSPSLVVADEPTASLDATGQADFLKLLKNLASDRNLAVLLISHSPEVQVSVSDRLLVMADGRIIEQGPPAFLYARAKDERVRALLRVAHPKPEQRTIPRESQTNPPREGAPVAPFERELA